MKPSECVRKAIEVLTVTHDWCQGAAAKDHAGRDVRLYHAGIEGDSRARINPQATQFSIYGAIAKVLAENPHCAQTGLMWETLDGLASQIPVHGLVESSAIAVHPVVVFNEGIGRTKEEIIDFLNGAVAALVAAETGSDVPEVVPFINGQPLAETPPETPETSQETAEPPVSVTPEPAATSETVVVPPAVAEGIVGQIGFPKAEVPAPTLTEAKPATTGPAQDHRLPNVNWGGQ